MTEDEIRAIVRDEISKSLSRVRDGLTYSDVTFPSIDVADQIRHGRDYIKRTYGKPNTADA